MRIDCRLLYCHCTVLRVTKISRKGIMEHGASSIFHNATNTHTVKVDHVVSGNFGSFKLSQKVHAFRCFFYSTVNMTVRFQVIANNNSQNFHLTKWKGDIDFWLWRTAHEVRFVGGRYSLVRFRFIAVSDRFNLCLNLFQSIIKEWNKGAKIVACNCISAPRVAPSMAFWFTALLILYYSKALFKRAESWDHGASLKGQDTPAAKP